MKYKYNKIVAFLHRQVKFSEMTLDMFRMLQAVEYEPQEDLLQDRQTDASMIIKSPRPAAPANQISVSSCTSQSNICE